MSKTRTEKKNKTEKVDKETLNFSHAMHGIPKKRAWKEGVRTWFPWKVVNVFESKFMKTDRTNDDGWNDQFSSKFFEKR